ncbi:MULTISPECIES: hypothetical protein [unclassified Yoonia]|uniref:hypothetical protein n=1 Tax=unclassified Yoonia TaxID=2629118 RepID=UPI002AFE96ED|nr:MULTISPECIES: hypothetical protein [unclassified Yoonia]
MDYSGWADWQPSPLTNTGSPAEIMFRAGQNALRVTVEVDDPATAPTRRLNKACAAMAALGGTPPDPILCDIIALAQARGPLTYGARLQITHTGDRCDTVLLVELPAQGAGLARHLMPEVGAGLALIDQPLHLTMLSYDGKSGALSLHGTIFGATRHHLPPLADISGVAPDWLAMAIDGLAEIGTKDPFPATNLGFSFAAKTPGQPPELTVFLAAKELFGNDDKSFQRVMACGGRRMRGYAALLQQTHPAPPGMTLHGQIGLTARAGNPPVLSVNVAAPWSRQPANPLQSEDGLEDADLELRVSCL